MLLCLRLLDLANAIAPWEVKRERKRLRRAR